MNEDLIKYCVDIIRGVMESQTSKRMNYLSNTEIISLAYSYKDTHWMSGLISSRDEWINDNKEFGGVIDVSTPRGIISLIITGRVRFTSLYNPDEGSKIVDLIIIK